jgi:hypothetical protein
MDARHSCAGNHADARVVIRSEKFTKNRRMIFFIRRVQIISDRSVAVAADDVAQLENGQKHADHHAADDYAEDDNQNRFEQ